MSTLFEGRTIDEALEKAAAAFGVEPGALDYEFAGEKTDDFWGLGDKVLVVRAWIRGAREASVLQPEPAAVVAPPPAPAPPAVPDREAPAGEDVPDFFRARREPAQARAERHEPAAPVPATRVAQPPAEARSAGSGAPEELTAEAEALLGRIFTSMGFECRATATLDSDVLQVVIAGDDNTFLLEERGRGLSALELVLNHALRHRTDQDRLRIRVDAEDFRSQREDELRDLALQLAHRAKETGQEQSTEPMNSYERRLVHLALAEDPGVTTRSLGQGFVKAVSIIPTGRADRRR